MPDEEAEEATSSKTPLVPQTPSTPLTETPSEVKQPLIALKLVVLLATQVGLGIFVICQNRSEISAKFWISYRDGILTNERWDSNLSKICRDGIFQCLIIETS